MHLSTSGGRLAVVTDGVVHATARSPVSLDAGMAEALRATLTALPQEAPVTSVTIASSWLPAARPAVTGLAPVAVLRLAHSDRTVFQPLSGWPPMLRDAVHGWSCVQSGGCDLTGRPLGQLDRAAVLRFVSEAVDQGAQSLAVSAVGAPVLADQETAVAEVVRQQFPDLHITLSHEVGGLGILARENTAVLNAALHSTVEALADACTDVVRELLPGTTVLFGRHDAASMNTEYLRRFPVAATAVEVAAMLRGAGVLAGVPDAAVLEWDGTGGRAGLLDDGLPRRHGPAGDPPLSLPAPEVTEVGAHQVDQVLTRLLADRRRPVVAVGDEPYPLPEAEPVEHPAFAAAVGAAVAQPAAEVDRVLVEPAGGDVADVVDQASEEALARTVSAGASPNSVVVTGVHTSPVSYLPGNVVRVQVRAAGTV